MSTGYSILSRNQSKLCKLTDTIVLATAGFRGDISTLQKLLRAKLTEYVPPPFKGLARISYAAA